MTERISFHKYVNFEDVPAYLQLGWLFDGYGPLPRHHAEYSVLLDWPGPGEPPIPAKEHDASEAVQK